MIYHHVILDTILPPLTYAYHEAIAIGSRVLVALRGKTQIGVVWDNAVQPDIAPEKILPIQCVFADGFRLPESWCELVAFTARYYHYPIGQTAFTALPKLLKKNQNIELPQPPVCYTLNAFGKAQTPPPPHYSKQAALWQALCSGCWDSRALSQIHPKAKTLLAEYQQQGWLAISEQGCPPIPPALHDLNAEQCAAIQSIQAALGRYQPFLLHGITGSGKTEVYFEVMAQVLAQGKQVLFLLPEINLTPQLLKRINQRFPDMPTAILHSQMATGARGRDYLRALLGQARLVLGTRLSVFTPLRDVGLIVVDEEHDDSFKQDNELRYHARDLAIWRARQAACPIILGSATPSLESWHKAQSGAYTLLTLSHRANRAATLPEIRILDVRRVPLDNGLSPQAIQLLKDNQQKGGLSLVYVNRRGFAPALFCGDCGHTFGCPHCSAKMVLHQRAGQLRCHHCDFRQPVPQSCAECGNQDLTAIGFGTQRIEETLTKIMPTAQIARVDRDSTQHKQDWEQLYARIQAHTVDVLVGTQMLAKGHDFARLNLVVVVNADGALFSSDFRAPERLFAELMQVSGRAGRAEMAGQVIIQTRLPEHALFAAIKQQNYVSFANNELIQRQTCALPPYGFQAAIRADAPKMADAITFLNEYRDIIAPMLPEHVFQFGAVPMLMARLAERERAQLFIESSDRVALHRALSLWTQILTRHRTAAIRWHIDVDYQEM